MKLLSILALGASLALISCDDDNNAANPAGNVPVQGFAPAALNGITYVTTTLTSHDPADVGNSATSVFAATTVTTTANQAINGVFPSNQQNYTLTSTANNQLIFQSTNANGSVGTNTLTFTSATQGTFQTDIVFSQADGGGTGFGTGTFVIQ